MVFANLVTFDKRKCGKLLDFGRHEWRAVKFVELQYLEQMTLARGTVVYLEVFI